MQKTDNTPVVIGISSISQNQSFKKLDEALILMNLATKNAINDAGNNKITEYIEEIQIPKGYWKYRDPGRWIAKKNNIFNAETSVTKVGVLQQNLINTACLKIQNGDISGSLIVGGESRYKRVLSKKLGEKYIETELTDNPDHYIKAIDELRLPEEENELGQMAVGYYAILESAFRASNRIGIDTHNQNIANLYKKFSEIASKNKDSWNKVRFSKQDILDCSINNPMQAFPYNKLHCTSWNVNQSSAMIIVSKHVADKLNISESKRVYPLASSESNFMVPTILRDNLIEPIGMKLAAEFIIKICDDYKVKPNVFDLYSCFPIAVQMFAKSLCLDSDSLYTVTGGMSFAGGPLNHYVLTSSVKMIEEIRSDSKKIGLITGVSGMMTKQSYALWAKNPLNKFKYQDVTEQTMKIDCPRKLSKQIDGKAMVIGYTIINKENQKKAIIFSEDSNKNRKILITREEKYIKDMEKKEWVGKEIKFNGKYLV